ncbi:hypothetical protein EZ449_08550 [Pedobacter frigidisoli]|uniref:Uncharacterized protein n=1 Tax=Pedobacter frigidisoli TaxID=2530455 RepID=A0A4R0P3X3_9SPHI|nr:hypothetical protein [Pedobacter frigidisoli]TCD10392.1 hypothetical protein EZ449_08550 [Pedobacter frigidisoli]
MKVAITDEMRTRAKIESQKRNPNIKHHFEVTHLSYSDRDELGFLGEFACFSLLGLAWQKNIRENYDTIDDFDCLAKGLKADIKTETIPRKYASKILNKSILDNELYGKRLIHEGQFKLLSKYDIVIFGFFIRDEVDFWYPMGYIETEIILKNYPPTVNRSDGGKYPFAGSPIPTSILKPFSDLV